jgi:hypothetical protein
LVKENICAFTQKGRKPSVIADRFDGSVTSGNPQ